MAIQHGHYQQHSKLKDSAHALGKIAYRFGSNKNVAHLQKLSGC